MPTVHAYCLCLLSVPTVCAYCLCLSVPVCACLCLPVYAYLSVPTYLCLPVCATCLCLPVYTYRLCLPCVPPVCDTVYAYLSVIWGKGRPDQRLRLI